MEVDILPQVVSSGTIVGVTSKGIPVVSSLGDYQASFLGSVPNPEESMLINIGTGSQLSALVNEIHAIPKGMEARPFPGGGVLLAGAALSGGRSYALLENFFRQLISAYARVEIIDVYLLMERLLRQEPNMASDLTVNPLFLGTRGQPDVRGSVEGITLDNFTPGNLAHAFLQGMVDELYAFYAAFQANTAKPFRSLIGSGNALRANPYLCTKVQATFGIPLVLSNFAEEAALGAALCAAVGTGAIGSFRETGVRI